MTHENIHPPDSMFGHDWQVEILEASPLIAPAKHYVYPQAVEEVERGALQIYFRSRADAETVLATFALGFDEPTLPHGVWSCPNSRQMCAIAGGYAYVIDAANPDDWMQIPYRPVTWVGASSEHKVLLFASFHRLWALGVQGTAWETDRLSWEGLRVVGIVGQHLHGFGWDLETDAEVPFKVDLATGESTWQCG